MLLMRVKITERKKERYRMKEEGCKQRRKKERHRIKEEECKQRRKK